MTIVVILIWKTYGVPNQVDDITNEINSSLRTFFGSVKFGEFNL